MNKNRNKKLGITILLVLLITLLSCNVLGITATTTILPETAYTNDSLEVYFNTSNGVEENITLEWEVFKNDVSYKSVYDLETDSDVDSGIPDQAVYTHIQDYIIINETEYVFFGKNDGNYACYQRESTGDWFSNSSMVSGLTDGGLHGGITVFEIDDELYSINTNFGTVIYGYKWNGTSWVSNSDIINGITNPDGDTYMSTFEVDGTLRILFSYNYGTYGSFDWNGTSWVSNNTFTTGLTDLGTRVQNFVYQDGEDLYLLLNEFYAGKTETYQWNGTSWVSDSNLKSGLPTTTHTSGIFFIKGNYWNYIYIYTYTAGHVTGYKKINELMSYTQNTSYNFLNISSDSYVKDDVINITITVIENETSSYETSIEKSINNSIPLNTYINLTFDSNLLNLNTSFTDLDDDYIYNDIGIYQNDVLYEKTNYEKFETWKLMNSDVSHAYSYSVFEYENEYYAIGIGYGSPDPKQSYKMINNSWVEYSDILNGYSFISSGFSSTDIIEWNNTILSITLGSVNHIYQTWNGTSWNEISMNSGMVSPATRLVPALYYNNSNLCIIIGNNAGTLYGYYWNSTSWVSDSSLYNGIGDLGYNSAPTIIEYDNKNIMLVGRSGTYLNSYYWDDTVWVTDNNIKSGIVISGKNSITPKIYNIGNVYRLLMGSYTSTNDEYDWYHGFDGSSNNNILSLNLSEYSFVKDDNITMKVSAFDGDKNSILYTSNTYTIPNRVPYNPVVRIDPINPTYNQDLDGYCNGSDIDVDDTLYFYYKWYKNGVYNTGSSTTKFAQDEYKLSIISSSSTSYGDNWTFSCMVGDGELNSSWVNSTEVFVDYAPPSIIYISPMNNSNNMTNNMYLNVSIDTQGLDVNMTFLDGSDTILATFNGITNNTNYEYNWLLDWDTNYNWSINLSHMYGNELLSYNFSTIEVMEAENTHLESKTDDSLYYEWNYNTEDNYENCNIFVLDKDDVEVQQLYITNVSITYINVTGLNSNERYETEVRCCARYDGVLSCISKYTEGKTSGWNTDFLSQLNKKLVTIPEENITTDLTNYTLTLSLNASDINFSNLQTDFDDIRFSDYGELNYYDFDVTSLDYNNNLSTIEVLIDNIDKDYDTKIFMYYNSDTATNNESVSTSWTGTVTNYTIGEELILSDFVHPSITGLTSTDLTSSTARIYWNSSQLTDNWVEYSTNPFLFDSTISSYDNQTYNPNITLSGLSDNQKYWFKAISDIGGVEATENDDFTLGTYDPITIVLHNYTENRVTKVSTVCYDVTDLKGDTNVDLKTGYWKNDETSFSYTTSQTTSSTGIFCFDISVAYGDTLHMTGIANGTRVSYTTEYVNEIKEPVNLFIGNPTDDFENTRTRTWEGFREGAIQYEDYAWIETNITTGTPVIKVWSGTDYDDSKSTNWQDYILTCNAEICYKELTGLNTNWYTFELWNSTNILVNRTKPSLDHKITEARTDMYAYTSFNNTEVDIDYTLLYFHDLIYNMSAKEHCLYYANGTLKTGTAATSCSYATYWGDDTKAYDDDGILAEEYGTAYDRGMTFRGQVVDASLTDSGLMKSYPYTGTGDKDYGLRYCHSFIVNYWDKPVAFKGTKQITNYYMHSWKADTYRTKELPGTPYNTYINVVDMSYWNETMGNAISGSLAWNQLEGTKVYYPTGFYEKTNYKGTDVCPDDEHDNLTCLPVGADYTSENTVDTYTSSQTYFDFPDHYIHYEDQNIDSVPIRLWNTKKTLDTPITVTDSTIYDYGIFLDTIAYQRRPQIIFGTYHQSFVVLNLPDNTTLQGLDSDSDGLTDYNELFVYNTNPKWSDTDSDGYTDFEEISSATDPNLHYDAPAPTITITISDDTITSFDSTNISCNSDNTVYDVNFSISNSTSIIFYTNVINTTYQFNGSNESIDNYTVSCYGENVWNDSTLVTDSFEVTEGVLVNSNITSIRVDDYSPDSAVDVRGYCTYNDEDNSTVTFDYKWIKEGVDYLTVVDNTSYNTTEEILVATLDNVNTNKGESWNFSCRVNNGVSYSDWSTTNFVVGGSFGGVGGGVTAPTITISADTIPLTNGVCKEPYQEFQEQCILENVMNDFVFTRYNDELMSDKDLVMELEIIDQNNEVMIVDKVYFIIEGKRFDLSHSEDSYYFRDNINLSEKGLYNVSFYAVDTLNDEEYVINIDKEISIVEETFLNNINRIKEEYMPKSIKGILLLSFGVMVILFLLLLLVNTIFVRKKNMV